MRLKAWIAAGLVLAGATACSGATATEKAVAPPASVAAVVGSPVPAVHLSSEAASRLGLATAPARLADAVSPDGVRSAHRLVIPYSAVVYDRDGSSWTYAETGAFTYLRKPITIDFISGDLAVLTKGPAVGTKVVTVGSPELLGVEYNISGEE